MATACQGAEDCNPVLSRVSPGMAAPQERAAGFRGGFRCPRGCRTSSWPVSSGLREAEQERKAESLLLQGTSGLLAASLGTSAEDGFAPVPAVPQGPRWLHPR